jgi:osmotically-inducible protein OsmY
MDVRTASIKDRKIVDLIKDALARDDRVNAENITVEEEDGNVTLRGSAANVFEKGAAEMIAKRVKGVKRVENRMGVSRGKVKPTDAQIRSNAQGVLSHARDVENNHITVQVADGVATLTGRVPFRGMRQRAEDLVLALSGVKEVRNELRIAGESRPDTGDVGMSPNTKVSCPTQ